MGAFYYDSSTIMRYLRKVLNEIQKNYIDSSMRSAFIIKRYAERYGYSADETAKLVLLCLLKDIGVFYQDGLVDENNKAAAAASSYAFLKHCSPLGKTAKPLLYYNAKYIEGLKNKDYHNGLLITLVDSVVKAMDDVGYEEIKENLRSDPTNYFEPNHVKKLFDLLDGDSDILNKLNPSNSFFVYEVASFLQHQDYSDEELKGFIDTTNFAFEFHNHETLAHTVTTAIIAKELAIITKMTPEEIQTIYLAGLVHDIGKIRVPAEILCYPGRLEDEQLAEMRRHVQYTREILEGSFSYKIVTMASHHHEKLDGSGYPEGLPEDKLSIGDKILAVADIASALYCKRSYKAAFTPEMIIKILEGDASKGLIDRRIVNHFVNNMDDIMAKARAEEEIVLKNHENMLNDYKLLSESIELKRFFE